MLSSIKLVCMNVVICCPLQDLEAVKVNIFPYTIFISGKIPFIKVKLKS